MKEKITLILISILIGLFAFPLFTLGGTFVFSQQEEHTSTFPPSSVQENQITQDSTEFFYLPLIILVIVWIFLIFIYLWRKIKNVIQFKLCNIIVLPKIKLTKSSIIILLTGIILVSGIGCGVGEYFKISKIIRETEQLTKEEKYDEAIQELEILKNTLFGKILSQKINTELEKNKRLLEDKIEYTQGLEEFNKENWEQAKELLSKVSENSPYYQDAKNKIEEAQKKIIEKQIAEEVKKETKIIQKKIEEEKAKEIAELQQKLKELEKKQLESSSGLQYSVSSIVEYWRPRIAYVTCNFENLIKQSGSGTVLPELPGFNGQIPVLTNKHVIIYEGLYDEYVPDYCNVKIGNELYRVSPEKMRFHIKEYDSAILFIDNPSQKLKEIANSWKNEFCQAKVGKVGDSIVVLGFPAIGSPSDITATEGIISGYEDYYYITSAKIDAGNSGGAAILLIGNCFLGIPTYTVKGKAESLGRILDFYQTLSSP
jgi:hypothetical protein